MLQGDPDADDLVRKRAAFVARQAGPPPSLTSGAWTVFLDLFELLNEFAVTLIEVPSFRGIQARLAVLSRTMP